MTVNIRAQLKIGTYCINGDKNEDRYALSDGLSIDASKLSNFSAFAVFDGHGGNFGSQYCMQNLLPGILQKIAQTTQTIERVISRSIVTDQSLVEVLDAVICDSMSKTAKSLNTDIKSQSVAGTT